MHGKGTGDKTRRRAHLIVYDRESHLYVPDDETLAVGDTVQAIRGNGPREGEPIGSATITGFDQGAPLLDVRFDG